MYSRRKYFYHQNNFWYPLKMVNFSNIASTVIYSYDMFLIKYFFVCKIEIFYFDLLIIIKSSIFLSFFEGVQHLSNINHSFKEFFMKKKQPKNRILNQIFLFQRTTPPPHFLFVDSRILGLTFLRLLVWIGR